MAIKIVVYWLLGKSLYLGIDTFWVSADRRQIGQSSYMVQGNKVDGKLFPRVPLLHKWTGKESGRGGGWFGKGSSHKWEKWTTAIDDGQLSQTLSLGPVTVPIRSLGHLFPFLGWPEPGPSRHKDETRPLQPQPWPHTFHFLSIPTKEGWLSLMFTSATHCLSLFGHLSLVFKESNLQVDSSDQF